MLVAAVAVAVAAVAGGVSEAGSATSVCHLCYHSLLALSCPFLMLTSEQFGKVVQLAVVQLVVELHEVVSSVLPRSYVADPKLALSTAYVLVEFLVDLHLESLGASDSGHFQLSQFVAALAEIADDS